MKMHPALSNLSRTKLAAKGSQPELFIEDVGSDRISDITTKIIKSVLIEFTQEQCKIHGIPMHKTLQKDIFDYKTCSWINRNVQLPMYFNKPIIFVPKDIVRLENTAGQNLACFYRFAIRNFVSRDKKMLIDVSRTGKDGKLLIRDVQSKYPISKESLSNWSIHYGKLLVDYKSNHTNGQVKPSTDSELMNIVYDKKLPNAS